MKDEVQHSLPAARATELAKPSLVSSGSSDERTTVNTLAASVVLGTILGLNGPLDAAIPAPYNQMSSVLGWSYFFAWTISFYPQLWTNIKRKSVVGLSQDFIVYSLIGFLCYAVYTSSLYFNEGVQEAYKLAHHGASNDVQLADVLFAGHAVAICGLFLYQYSIYERDGQGLSPTCKAVTGLITLATAGFWAHIQSTCDPGAAAGCGAWLSLLYFLGTVKIVMTVVKYAPQALLNHRRRSTVGWQVSTVLLDTAGAMMCLGQIVLDAAARQDWSIVTGNPAKLGISTVSLFFDALFVFQHYVLYKDSWSGSSNAASSSSMSSNGTDSEAKRLKAVRVVAEEMQPLNSRR